VKTGNSVRAKIILAFAACIAIMSVLGGYGIVELKHLDTAIASSYSEDILPVVAIADTEAAVLLMHDRLASSAASRSKEDGLKALEAAEAYRAQAIKAWTLYYPAHVSADDERAVSDVINADLEPLHSLVDDMRSAIGDADWNRADTTAQGSAARFDRLEKSLKADKRINVVQARSVVDDSTSVVGTALTIEGLLVAAGLVVSLIATRFLLGAIMNPLERARTIANAIAEGRLGHRMEIHRDDEFGSLLQSLDRMDRQLSETVRHIQFASDHVAEAAKEISTGNTDLSHRTERQAAALEETASSLMQITETVRQNAQHAADANAMTANAADLTVDGDRAVQEMVTTIEAMTRSSTKISEITGLIESIAFQTNILALNAAVEAARAGDEGRGFAVVASEVRNLAQRSAQAAKEIHELITSSVTLIRSGANQASHVGSAMEQLKRAIRRVDEIVGEIANASSEQSVGIEQVNTAVAQMDEVTQQNAALVEEAAAAARSLEEQANQLTKAASVFVLES
jgi:methyl-accepting chemotaxis protein